MNKLIDIYNEGWTDCPDGISHVDDYTDPKERKAYETGWMYYLIGDDMPSVDYATDEEVLGRINAGIA